MLLVRLERVAVKTGRTPLQQMREVLRVSSPDAPHQCRHSKWYYHSPQARSASQGLLCRDWRPAEWPDPTTFTQDVVLMAVVPIRPALDDAFVVGHKSHPTTAAMDGKVNVVVQRGPWCRC